MRFLHRNSNEKSNVVKLNVDLGLWSIICCKEENEKIYHLLEKRWRDYRPRHLRLLGYIVFLLFIITKSHVYVCVYVYAFDYALAKMILFHRWYLEPWVSWGRGWFPKWRGYHSVQRTHSTLKGNHCLGLYRRRTLKRVEELSLLVYTCFEAVGLVPVLFQVWMLKGIRLSNNQVRLEAGREGIILCLLGSLLSSFTAVIC